MNGMNGWSPCLDGVDKILCSLEADAEVLIWTIRHAHPSAPETAQRVKKSLAEARLALLSVAAENESKCNGYSAGNRRAVEGGK